ncbi:STAS domain-containing protein [Lentzea sp. NEAU-D7]|uniref:STAS domain-containing protein n=1 Tax=Lentzea sp. NEAU-D7 TaxID=2994667 RepID=UPI00224A8977|nr:STAS domain-containing protein [Lentzea sp. NEAU-D7]MCX2951549.1 STAS domain-containing protein [Lentzea sp. NEAU-D7]
MTAGETASTAGMKTSDHDGVVVAVISGELDMISVDGIGTALFDQVDKRPAGLVVELAVDFMGSSALSMLLELNARSQREGVELVIVAAQAAAVRPMMASALSQVLPLAQSVDEAVKLVREERESSEKPG